MKDILELYYHIFFIENKLPNVTKDSVDTSSIKSNTTNDQRRKSSTVITGEEMNHLEERFDKWINEGSLRSMDDLFDGLKVK